MRSRITKMAAFFFAALLTGVGGVQFSTPDVLAQSSYYTSQGCSGCHLTTPTTCNGCHAHGTHPSSAKSSINVAGATNKTSYAPGETVSVTITGGYRSGWFRAVLLNQNSVEVARSTGNDSGMGSSTTYPATLSAPAPTTPGTYTWKVGWYGNTNDTSSAAFGSGWTADATNPDHGYEMVNTNSFTVVAPADATAPVVNTFTLPATSTSLTVPVIALSATDNVAVTGYMVTLSSVTPAASASGWTSSAPTSVVASSPGSVIFFAWAKDAAGNVSGGRGATVAITLPDTTVPVVNTFTLPATSTSLTVPVIALSATDNVAVTGYMVTASATKPLASAAGWTAAVPASVTAAAPGSVTFYAWAKDAAGNVSANRSATVNITLPDTTAPVVNTFTLPASSSNLTVIVSAFNASDNVGVTGYMVTTSAAAPSSSAGGWTSIAPGSVAAPSAGSVTFYAWAKDAAGNVSTAKSATVNITLPDTTAPVVNTFTLPATSTSLTVSVSALSATDNVAVTGYMVNTSATAPTASAAGWTSTPPSSVTASAAGSVTFYAWAKDAAGNVSLSRSATVVIQSGADITKPVLSVSALADGSYTNKPTLNVTGTATDEGGLKSVTVNGQPVVVNADGSFSTALTLAIGANAVAVVATDNAGNQQSDTRTITYDNNAPVLTITDPADNSISVQSFLTVSGTIDEKSTVTVKVNNGSPQSASISGSSFSATVNLVSGVNTIEITATDLAGNQSSAKRTVSYDGGSFTLAVTYPNQDITTIKSSIVVTGKIVDATSRVRVTVTMDGRTYTPRIDDGAFKQRLTFTRAKLYAISVTATDAAGNSSTVVRNVIYRDRSRDDDHRDYDREDDD